MNIVVTGATQGIGRAIAERFAKEAFNLCICARSLNDLKAMQHDVLTNFAASKVYYYQADLSKKEEVFAFASYVNTVFDTVEVLVNNAGVFKQGLVSLPSDQEIQDFEQMMDTNLYSAYYLTQKIVPLMLKNTAKPYIFNIASIASIKPYGAYSVSKFAMLGWSKVLREELKNHNIRVSSVMPGATLTASWAAANFPEERFIDAQDLADLLWSTYNLSSRTVVEELVIRPQLGDI